MYRRSILIGALYLFIAHAAHAQSAGESHSSAQEWFALLEIPFLVGCVVFAFMTAFALRGGRFGSGMQLLAWGFLVMAVGHLHMQIDLLMGFNLFNTLLGAAGGSFVWFLALMLTWGLSAAGFYQMYRASK